VRSGDGFLNSVLIGIDKRQFLKIHLRVFGGHNLATFDSRSVISLYNDNSIANRSL
jgi:hypothetical protein